MNGHFLYCRGAVNYSGGGVICYSRGDYCFLWPHEINSGSGFLMDWTARKFVFTICIILSPSSFRC